MKIWGLFFSAPPAQWSSGSLSGHSALANIFVHFLHHSNHLRISHLHARLRCPIASSIMLSPAFWLQCWISSSAWRLPYRLLLGSTSQLFYHFSHCVGECAAILWMRLTRRDRRGTLRLDGKRRKQRWRLMVGIRHDRRCVQWHSITQCCNL